MLPVGIEFDERGEDKAPLMQSRMGNGEYRLVDHASSYKRSPRSSVLGPLRLS